MTSSIFEPRMFLVDISPRTQRTASVIFDFPLPLGPTTTVMPRLKFRTVLSGKDLNPCISRALSLKSVSFDFV